MTVKISQNSFVVLLEKSGLIGSEQLGPLVDEFRNTEGGNPEEGELLAQFLVRKGRLTTWQARKLLQGKHKGFTLGKYRLLSLLGRGGMSSVYLAEHQVMRRRCAIKVLPSKQVNDQAALNRFHQEAQAVAALDDPHIVRAYDVDSVQEGTSQIHFLVMEYVEGRSLQELVDQDGPLAIPDAIDYICQAARGLGHAHRAGMVHRDIKPSNLLLDQSGTIKVLDMGLARFFEQTDQQSLTLEHDQRVLGTADYLSPEQAVDSHGVDTRSDIYSLGGTLYFLLTGHPPFPEGTLAQRLLAHQTRRPRPVTEERPDVPGSLVKILDRMMAKSRDDRQASVDEVRDQLQAWLKQQGEEFLKTSQPPAALRKGIGRKQPDPTADGWREAPTDQFTPPPGTADGDSGVADDPHLGAFLSSLSSQDHSQQTDDSDRLSSAKTVVSQTRPAPVPVTPDKVPSPDPSGISVMADSGVDPHRGSTATLAGSRIRRRKNNLSGLLLGGAAGLGALVIGGYFLLVGGTQPDSQPTNTDQAATQATEQETADNQTAINQDRPHIDPGSDIRVGPDGHFASISEAVDYVQETFHPLSATDQRTIRVAGGRTYADAINIDNSQFGAFPQGVQIICDDPQPAVLAPPGSDPVVNLINVERFHMQGFELAGGDRPVTMRLEGYMVGTSFERLTLREVAVIGIESVGVTGFGGRRVEFKDIVVHQTSPQATGIVLNAGAASTRELRLHRIRFGGRLAAGVRLEGEVDHVEISQCRFDNVATPILFATAGQLLEDVTIVNNTFRRFDQGIRFAGLPQVGHRGVGFRKNLFSRPDGPEVTINGATDQQAAGLIRGTDARFNWSEGAGEPAAGLDIFADQGRHSVEAIEFAGGAATDSATFLQPRNPQLRSAASGAQNPKFIGAVAPSP